MRKRVEHPLSFSERTPPVIRVTARSDLTKNMNQSIWFCTSWYFDAKGVPISGVRLESFDRDMERRMRSSWKNYSQTCMCHRISWADTWCWCPEDLPYFTPPLKGARTWRQSYIPRKSFWRETPVDILFLTDASCAASMYHHRRSWIMCKAEIGKLLFFPIDDSTDRCVFEGAALRSHIRARKERRHSQDEHEEGSTKHRKNIRNRKSIWRGKKK